MGTNVLKRKNYKSDFDAILHLYACSYGAEGEKPAEVGWPDYDWEARFFTGTVKANTYVASCKGGVCKNCYNDNGRIHVVFNKHHLGAGVLNVEFYAALPNAIYPDGTQDEVSPQALGIELVTGRGDCGTLADVEVFLPMIKGDKGDKGDKGEDAVIPEDAVLSTDTESEVEQAEPNLLTEALRKTPQVLTKAERAQVLDNLGRPERLLFIDMWNEAWKLNNVVYGKYDPDNAPDAEHPYMGNDIWMTYEEAIEVMRWSNITNSPAKLNMFCTRCLTNLPITTAYTEFTNSFGSCVVVNHVNSHPVMISACYGIPTKRIINLDLGSASGLVTFHHIPNLIELKAKRIKHSVDVRQAHALSLDSFQYMVANAINTTAITITLHPDAYARITDDLFALAASKNITFASV